MALTLTEQSGSPRVVGNRKERRISVTPDSSYPAGGEAFTPATLGFVNIDSVELLDMTGAVGQVKYDSTAGSEKLLIYPQGELAVHTLTVQDDNSAATNGTPIYVDTSAGGHLYSPMANLADTYFRIGSGGPTVPVKHTDGHSDIRQIRQTASLDFGDFTDNTDTTGYVDLDTQLPVGALVLGWHCVTGTGFTGDTTAVLQVGTAADIDEFSADTTYSVLAAGTDAAASIAADTGDEAGSVTTVRLTVTGGADFTSISAGSITSFTVYYVMPATLVPIYGDDVSTDTADAIAANFDDGIDHLIEASDGSLIRIGHDATPTGTPTRTQLYIDDNAANDYEKILSVANANADYSVTTDDGEAIATADLDGFSFMVRVVGF